MDKSKIVHFKEIIDPFDLIYVFVHDYPDPDAIGAGMCLRRILKHLGKESLLMGMGLSHPQNKVMVNQLTVTLFNPFEYNFQEDIEKGYKVGSIFIDFHPSNGSTNFEYGQLHKIVPDWVLDHHMDKAVESYWDIQSVGSCCTMALDYLQYFEIELKHENAEDAELATGMLVGLLTDTKYLLRKGSTDRDDAAFKFLRAYYDEESLQEILNYRYPDYFYSIEVTAYNNKHKEGPLVILNLGYLSDGRRDVIPYIADHWQKHHDVTMVIAFGLINNAVCASVRTSSAAPVRAKELVQKVFMTGDGHPDMAGARLIIPKFWEDGLSDENHREGFLQFTMHNVISRARKIVDIA